jgi:hypothetical protein
MKSLFARSSRFAFLLALFAGLGCNSRGMAPRSVDAASVAPDGPAVAPDGPSVAPVDSQSDAAAPDLPGPPQAAAAKLDLLFLIDNTATNLEEQQALAASMPAFFRELQSRTGSPLDLQVAFVTSNMGAGNFAFNTCPPLGDRGRFQVRAGCGLDAQRARHLAVDDRGNRNFDGELAKVASCLVQVGIQGCTYGHSLQAMRFALSGNLNPENRSFLRPDAVLAIVLIADEDDCSADPEATIFQGVPHNFICALRGHACNGAPVPEGLFNAPLTACEPFRRQDDANGKANRLINVADFTSFIETLKPDHPERVLVAALIGWDDRPQAEYRIARMMNPANTTSLELAPVCLTGQRPPKPALRLKAFVDSLAARGSWHSVCPGDLAPTMEGIARRINATLASQ